MMDHLRQPPTATNLRIATSKDACQVLFIVECGLLQPVKRRPDDSEKARITHGDVFVWLDGAKGETGLERWTDGRQWGPSRCRDDFLIYEEKEGNPRLVKSTYTARRNTTDDNGALWHLIAYYYSSGLETLPSVADVPEYATRLNKMAPGYFVSNRKEKSKKAKEAPLPVHSIEVTNPHMLMAPSPNSIHGGGTDRVHRHSHSANSSPNHSPNNVPSRLDTLDVHHHHHNRPRLSLTVAGHDYNGNGSGGGGGTPPRTRTDHSPSINRHTDPEPFTYYKKFNHDYHHLPGPESASVLAYGVGSGEHLHYSPSSTPSSSPGLSPASTRSSPIEPFDEQVLSPGGDGHHHGHLNNINNNDFHNKNYYGPRYPSTSTTTSTTNVPPELGGEVKAYAYREPFTSAPSFHGVHGVVALPSIAAFHKHVGANNDSMDMVLDDMEGPARDLEDEKQLQKLAGTWSAFF